MASAINHICLGCLAGNVGHRRRTIHPLVRTSKKDWLGNKRSSSCVAYLDHALGCLLAWERCFTQGPGKNSARCFHTDHSLSDRRYSGGNTLQHHPRQWLLSTERRAEGCTPRTIATGSSQRVTGRSVAHSSALPGANADNPMVEQPFSALGE